MKCSRYNCDNETDFTQVTRRDSTSDIKIHSDGRTTYPNYLQGKSHCIRIICKVCEMEGTPKDFGMEVATSPFVLSDDDRRSGSKADIPSTEDMQKVSAWCMRKTIEWRSELEQGEVDWGVEFIQGHSHPIPKDAPVDNACHILRGVEVYFSPREDQ